MRRPFKATAAALLAAALLCAGARVPARAQAGGGQEGGPPVLDRGGAVFNVRAFGAKCDGSTNDLSAIRSAIAAAEAAGGGTVFVPPSASGCLISANSGAELLRITKAVALDGGGWNSKLVVGSGVPNTIDVIRYSPALDAGSYWKGQSLFFKVRNLNIQPQSGTPARYGVVLDTSDNTARYVARALIEENHIGPFGAHGIYLHGHATGTDEIFTSTIRRNQVEGGLLIVRGGDSLTIEDNAFTGAHSVDIEQVPYAAGLNFIDNSVTCSGGFVLRRSWNAHVIDNEFEAVSDDVGTASGAFVDFAGAPGGACGAGGNGVCSPVITGNSVVIDKVAIDAVRFDYVSGATFLHNTIDQRVAAKYHAKFTANSSGNLRGFNPVYGTGLGTQDAGTNNNAVVNNNSSSLTPNNTGNVGTTGWLVTGTGLYFQTPVTFAALPPDGNGTLRYCADCRKTTPCTGGGTGAIAKRLNGAWDCN